MEAKGERVTRHELRHDRHTVSLLTDHLVFSPKYRGRCCSVRWQRRRKKSSGKTFKKSFIKNASQSEGHGWEVVEKCIWGQKGLEKKDVIRGERGEGRGERGEV